MSHFEIKGVISASEIPQQTGRQSLDWAPIVQKLDSVPLGSVIHVQVQKAHYLKSIQKFIEAKRPSMEIKYTQRTNKGKAPFDIYIHRVK